MPWWRRPSSRGRSRPDSVSSCTTSSSTCRYSFIQIRRRPAVDGNFQITEEQCTKWSENPDSFVEDEDEDTFAYSVRISSQDLLMALSEEFEQECCASLAQVGHLLQQFSIFKTTSGY